MTLHSDMIADDIEREGSPAVLTRLTGTGDIHFDVNLAAVSRGYAPNEIVGEIIQGDREVRISNREILARQWPGPPKTGDQIALSGKSYRVRAVDRLEIGGETVMFVMQVRG